MLNIVPTSIGSEDVAAADALELYEMAGVDHPLYSMTLHPEGKPAMAKVERMDYDMWVAVVAAMVRASGNMCKVVSSCTAEKEIEF